jgi:hypothetical protein
MYWSNKNDFFNINSTSHAYFGFVLTQFLRHYVKSDFNNLLIGTFIHGYEDYLENTGTSMEGMFSYLIGCSKKGFLDVKDNDSLQNFIGDILSHIVGAILAFNYPKLSIKKIFILFFLQVLFYIIFCKISKKKKTESSQ